MILRKFWGWFGRYCETVSQVEKMSDRLYEMQTTVEVAAEALGRKDAELMEFVGRLHETMGGDTVPTTEAEALAALRKIRAHADMYVAIRDVLAGRFKADDFLLKRLACSLGCASWDVEMVIQRAGYLASVHAELTYDLARARERIAELENELEE